MLKIGYRAYRFPLPGTKHLTKIRAATIRVRILTHPASSPIPVTTASP